MPGGRAAAPARARGVRARCARTRCVPQRRSRAGRRGRHARHADRARAGQRRRGRLGGARSRAAAPYRAGPRSRTRPAAGRGRLRPRAPRARVRSRGCGAGRAGAVRSAAIRGSHPPTRPTRRRSRRPGGPAAGSSSCVPRSASSASSPPGTGRPCSRTASTTCRRRSCGCWPRSRGAATSCSRSRTSRDGLCSARSAPRSSGSPPAPRESSSCAPSPTARPPASLPSPAVSFGARRAGAARGRCAPPRRGRRYRRRGHGGRAEVCRLLRLGLAADEVLVVTPDSYDCEPLAAALERAGVDVALDTASAHSLPPDTRCAALPRGLGGWRS